MDSRFLMPFRCGETVRLKIDPRHEGRVRAVFSSRTIKVQWANGWVSQHHASELEHEKKALAHL